MHPANEMNPVEMLRQFPVTFTIPVQWGEQDPFGHVNNVTYFRWCETVRVLYLERIGLWQMYRTQKIGPIMAALGCNFRVPVEFPDTIHAGARVTRIGNSSFQMDHLLISEAHGVVADATSTLVVVDYNTGRPQPVPDEVRAAIVRLEGHELPAS